MATSLEVDFVILDHLSIVVSGISDGDERRTIDNLTTRLRSLVQQTGVGIIMVSHLRSKDGTPYEKGGEITLNDFRGSRSIVQLSDNVIGMERDQQSPTENNMSSLRLLKCRLIGELGVMDTLEYDRETGRLLPIDPSDFENKDEVFNIDFAQEAEEE
jgi:twinkle protein